MTRSLNIVQIKVGENPQQLAAKINHNFQQLVKPGAFSATDIALIQQEITAAEIDLVFNTIYPPGTIIMTASQSDSRLSRGVWQEVAKDKYLRGGSISTGGSNTVQISADNIPAHTHDINLVTNEETQTHTHDINLTIQNTGGTGSQAQATSGTQATEPNQTRHTHNLTGATDTNVTQHTPLTIEPAYEAFYFYRRVS